MKLYAIVDLKAKAVASVFVALNDEYAERSFLMLLTGTSSVFTDFPEDFALYPVGDLNFSNGVLSLVDMNSENLIAAGFKPDSVVIGEPVKRGSDYGRSYLSVVHADRFHGLVSEELDDGTSN